MVKNKDSEKNISVAPNESGGMKRDKENEEERAENQREKEK